MRGHEEKVRVVVVGGGTAGWMTAAALVRMLPQNCTVQLVESEAIGIVGVGEATLPHLRSFNEGLGIDERAFMRETKATFKLGIEFRGWGAERETYIHPFGTFGSDQDEIGFHHFWLRMVQERGTVPDFGSFSLGVKAAWLNRFQHPSMDFASITSSYGYAYQFDATLFAPFLRRYAEARGARRTEGRIVGVQQDALTGDISSVKLEDGQEIRGDLFIDCSGFRSLILGNTLHEPFEDWSQWLPCDRAAAVPSTTEGPITPYTSAIAMPAGWRWRIPLQHRTGNGYVYASNALSDDEAAHRLLEAIEGKPIGEPRFLRFKAGRRRRSWVRNCVAIGLSSGFLEPLESTSIYLVQAAITTLLELFPERQVSTIDRDEFNRLIDLEYDRIRDFLILHYHATRRSGTPFWDHARTMAIPDSLAQKMDLFRISGRVVKYRKGVFLEPSWLAVYIGQGILPSGHDPRVSQVAAETIVDLLKSSRSRVAAAAEAMPTHEDALTQVTETSAGAKRS